MLQEHSLSIKAATLHTDWATGSETGLLLISFPPINTAPHPLCSSIAQGLFSAGVRLQLFLAVLEG